MASSSNVPAADNVPCSPSVTPAHNSTKSSNKLPAKPTHKISPKRAAKVGKGRAGAPSHNKDDVNRLLEILESIEPIGANICALVVHELAAWSTANIHSQHHQDSLKTKCNKLCNAKNFNGDPSCPTDVRRAKQNARNIQATIAEKRLANDINASTESIDNSDEEKNETDEGTVGAWKKFRPIGQIGVHGKKLKTEEVLIKSVESMTKFMGVIANSFASPVSGLNDQEVMITIVVKKCNIRDALVSDHRMISLVDDDIHSFRLQYRAFQQGL